MPERVAALVFGLPRDCRIKRKIRNEKYSLDEMLLMNILDKLSVLVWQNTKDGKNGTNYPKSIFKKMCIGSEQKNESEEIVKFNKSEDFVSQWNKLKGQENG